MVLAGSAYNIPRGICVECGGEIIGKQRNALYCNKCYGYHSKTSPNKTMRIVTVSLLIPQLEELDFMEHAGLILSRSEGIRQAIAFWFNTFREPLDLTTAKLRVMIQQLEDDK